MFDFGVAKVEHFEFNSAPWQGRLLFIKTSKEQSNDSFFHVLDLMGSDGFNLCALPNSIFFRAKHNRAKLTISNSHAASEVRTQHSLAHTQRPSPSTRLVECGVIRSIAACAVNPPALVQRDHTDWLPERRLLHSLS